MFDMTQFCQKSTYYMTMIVSDKKIGKIENVLSEDFRTFYG